MRKSTEHAAQFFPYECKFQSCFLLGYVISTRILLPNGIRLQNYDDYVVEKSRFNNSSARISADFESNEIHSEYAFHKRF